MSKYESAERYMLQMAINKADREKKKVNRAELFRDARAKGMTYAQIGMMYGISTARVAQVCNQYDSSMFRGWTPEQCIYVNIRNWMNENKVSLSEMVRRNGLQLAPANLSRYRDYMRGGSYPRKKTIDKWIAITGLTYEQLWEVEHD